MNNLEENLKKIKIREIGEEDKESLWHRIVTARMEYEQKRSRLLSMKIFNISMNKLIVSALALFIILGGAGMVAASNDAVPGDLLFPVDLAIEKLQIKLAGENRAQDLKLKFAEERVAEITHVSDEKSVPDTSNINFSDKESDDVGKALTDLEQLLSDNNGNVKAQELEQSLQQILVRLGDDAKLELRKNGKEIRIKNGNQEIKIKLETGEQNGNTPKSPNSGTSGDNTNSNNNSNNTNTSSNNTPSKSVNLSRPGGDDEDENEDEGDMFCRGEWRSPEDCLKNTSGDSLKSINKDDSSEEDSIDGGSDDSEE